MRILITGKNGYVGKSVYNYFNNNWDKTYPSFFTAIGRDDFDLTDRNETNNYFFKYGYFDVVIHTAICGGSRLKKDSDKVISDNLKMFYNLLANRNRFGQLISFGSGMELNNPDSPYGLSKNIIWDIIKHDPKLNNIRIFGVFDENEWDTRFIKTCIKNYKNKKPLLIHQDKLFDFFYMKDLFKVIEFIISNPQIKKIDCVYKEHYRLTEIADYINTLGEHYSEIKIQEKKLGSPYTGYFVDYKLNLMGLKNGIKEIYDKAN
tara:strand:- start:688 stop:1473 length:786 start_codon:yes stop_codon:yes gene_type:complete